VWLRPRRLPVRRRFDECAQVFGALLPGAERFGGARRTRKVVKSAFAARRKTLRNAWRALAPLDELTALAQTAGIDLDKRGETLTVAEFGHMARLIEEREEKLA
jgi:16S rRNA A1518/A1519 N6-dimethyltransferase RsmA/KsgA/DIM1 with predicted DNA glycosylase/AP lyase activity